MPPTLTYPGVYIEELPSGVHTITGVATSITAFVGWAPQGSVTKATLVQSWQGFASQFGGLDSRSLLGYSVNQFFANGGQQAYIVRLVADGNDGTTAAGVATAELKDSNNNLFLTVLAANPGNWATNYGVVITPRSDNPQRFTLSTVYAPTGSAPQVVEAFQNLTLVQNDPLYVVNVINSDSSYLAFAPSYAPPTTTLSTSIPSTPFMLNGSTTPLYLQDQTTPTPNILMALQAKSPDTWPPRFAVSARAPTTTHVGWFDLEVLYTSAVDLTSPVQVELMKNLSINPADAMFAGTWINANSQFLRVPSTFAFPASNTALDLPAAFPATPTSLNNTTAAPIGDGQSVNFLTVIASDPFNWPQNIAVRTELNGTQNFDLEVVYNPAAALGVTVPIPLEKIMNLAVSAAGKTAINGTSNLVQVPASYTPPSTAPSSLTLPTTFAAATPTMLIPNLDGTVLQPNTGAFENKMLDVHSDGSHGVYFLSKVNIFNLLCVPGENTAAILSDLQEFCAVERAFLIVDCQQNDSFSTLQNGPPTGLLGSYSANSAFYFPWIQAPNPLQQNRLSQFPPCGFIAGIYAATDSARGVWKAPAGIDAGLTGAAGLNTVLSDLQNGTLNVQAINCLRQFNVYGNVVWGSRTLQGNDQIGSQWKYVPIRRFALFLESSLYDGTQWVVFEPNDETLWGQVRLNVGSFLQGLFLQGAFAGSTPQQAYFVKCDGENNPPTSVALGVVNILVGFAPLYPAEFVVIQIQQIALTS
jgi:phage tail sheath protein FI